MPDHKNLSYYKPLSLFIENTPNPTPLARPPTGSPKRDCMEAKTSVVMNPQQARRQAEGLPTSRFGSPQTRSLFSYIDELRNGSGSADFRLLFCGISSGLYNGITLRCFRHRTPKICRLKPYLYVIEAHRVILCRDATDTYLKIKQRILS